MTGCITQQDLEEFANNCNNGIEFRMCHSNAYKVYLQFDGKVHWGEATFVDMQGKKSKGGHFWNILETEGEKRVTEIVDIYNLKDDRKGVYTQHESWGEYSIDTLRDVVVNESL